MKAGVWWLLFFISTQGLRKLEKSLARSNSKSQPVDGVVHLR